MEEDGVAETAVLTTGVGPLLRCRLDSARTLSEALSCMMHGSTRRGLDVMITRPSKGGLRFAVEEAGCLQASVLMRENAFVEFECPDEVVLAILVDLQTLTDGLQVLADFAVASRDGGSGATWGMHPGSSLRLLYEKVGGPLVLTATEADGVSIRLVIRTVDGAGQCDFGFDTSNILNHVVIRSEPLREAIQELDFSGASVAELRLSPTPPRFRLECGDSRTGHAFVVELADPDDAGSDVFIEFKSMRVQVSCYNLKKLKRCVRALSMSESTKMRMNADGMLHMAIKMKSTIGTYFVEFTIVAEEIDGGEPDDDSQTHQEDSRLPL